MSRITCTVFFEDPFWVGVWERSGDGAYSAAKATFGAEPKDAEVLAFVLERFGTLAFSKPKPDDGRERSPVSNPKRMQRAAARFEGVDHDGEGYLLIDDLVDTGNTARIIRKLLPKAYFATLYAKPMGREFVDLCVKEFSQDKWVYFPWDIDYKFVPPLKKKEK